MLDLVPIDQILLLLFISLHDIDIGIHEDIADRKVQTPDKNLVSNRNGHPYFFLRVDNTVQHIHAFRNSNSL